MKKDYLSPELELHLFSFEGIMQESYLNVSKNEHGNSDNKDDDNNEW